MSKESILRLKSNDISAMWEIVENILLKVSDNLYEAENFNKIFSPFLLCRYISMRKDLLGYAVILSQVNSCSKLTNEEFYKFAYELIPKQSNDFIKYIKKQKKEEKTDETELIETGHGMLSLEEL